MNKYLLFAGICFSIFVLSSSSFDFTGDPYLPASPFDYETELFPDHLLESDWGVNDSTIFDHITDDGATLGRVLFFDELLSANNDMSCATCHRQELSFSDDVAFSEGVNNNTFRNSMKLSDLGWSNYFAFFWDISQPTLRSTIKLPLADPNEIGATDINALINKMNATSYYPNLFYNAFGTSVITDSLIVEGLVQFISSMTTFESKFDKSHDIFSGVTLSLEENRGKLIFDQDCELCHTDGNSFIQRFNFIHNNGLVEDSTDLGVGMWDSTLAFLFKPPSLRNIELSAPFMHDGRFATLEDVIDHYAEGAINNDWNSVPPGGFGYTPQERADLLAFLKTLTDYTLVTHEKWSDPFIPPTSNSQAELTISELSLFPNPTADALQVSFDNPQNLMTYIQIFDAGGRLVKKSSGHRALISINVGHLSTGNYVATVKQGDASQSASFVIAR